MRGNLVTIFMGGVEKEKRLWSQLQILRALGPSLGVGGVLFGSGGGGGWRGWGGVLSLCMAVVG